VNKLSLGDLVRGRYDTSAVGKIIKRKYSPSINDIIYEVEFSEEYRWSTGWYEPWELEKVKELSDEDIL
jgi:hypothetical protein